MKNNAERGPTITIAVISHEQIHLVENLLNSLQGFSNAGLHVVVLENAQNQPTLHDKEYHFQLTYLKNDKLKSLAANINHVFDNFGRSSEYFCILNPDVVFEEEVFLELLSRMDKHRIDISSPIVVDHSGIIQDTFRPLPKPLETALRFLNLNKINYEFEALPPISYPDWIAGVFMLMPSEVFEQVGGYNLRYPLYFEDVEFCIRARLKGYQIGVSKNLKVVHDAQRSSHRKARFFFKHFYSTLVFFSSEEHRLFKQRRKQINNPVKS